MRGPLEQASGGKGCSHFLIGSGRGFLNLLVLSRCQSWRLIQVMPRRPNDLPPLWQPLWDSVVLTRNQSLLPALDRYVLFLDSLQIAPEEVSDDDLVQYGEALALNELRRSPAEAARRAAYAWNLAARPTAEWPKPALKVPSRGRRHALPLTAFPDTLAQELDSFLQKIERHPRALPRLGSCRQTSRS